MYLLVLRASKYKGPRNYLHHRKLYKKWKHFEKSKEIDTLSHLHTGLESEWLYRPKATWNIATRGSVGEGDGRRAYSTTFGKILTLNHKLHSKHTSHFLGVGGDLGSKRVTVVGNHFSLKLWKQINSWNFYTWYYVRSILRMQYFEIWKWLLIISGQHFLFNDIQTWLNYLKEIIFIIN